MKYDFDLQFKLTSAEQDPDELVGRLGNAGCDDSTVGIGVPGRIALMFTREAHEKLRNGSFGADDWL